MPANFNPDFVGYTNQGAFRFWCQKVLPLVYDDSLSYYELLNKVVNYLNNTISDVANVETNLNALHTAYGELENYVNERTDEQRKFITLWAEKIAKLQEFVNNYFDNLDVQEEIDNKLDEMAADGSLSELFRTASMIENVFAPIISEWLKNNVTPTTPVIDKTLTIEGAGADSAVTGAKVHNNRFRPSKYNTTFLQGFISTTTGIIGESDTYIYCKLYGIENNVPRFIVHRPPTTGLRVQVLQLDVNNQVLANEVITASVTSKAIDFVTGCFSIGINVYHTDYSDITPAESPEVWIDIEELANKSFPWDTAPSSTYKKERIFDTFIEGEYARSADGNLGGSGDWYRTNIFRIDGDKKYKVDGDMSIAQLIMYDQNFKYLGFITLTSYSPKLSATNAYWGVLNFNGTLTEETEHRFYEIEAANVLEYPFSNCEKYSGSFVRTDGSINTSEPDWDVLLVPIKDKTKVFVSYRILRNVAVYDKNGNVIRATDNENDYADVEPNARMYQLPENAALVAFNAYNSTGDANLYSKQYFVFYDDTAETVCAIGDSITFLDNRNGYPISGNRYVGWQSYLRKCGYIVTSYGYSGYPYAHTTETPENREGNGITDMIVNNSVDLSGFDKIILFGGANDVRLSVPFGDNNSAYDTPNVDVNTFTGAIGKLVNYIRGNAPNAYVYIASTLPSESQTRKYAKNNSYIDKIKLCSNFWSLYFINLFIEMDVSPTVNFSEYFYDDVHPNERGALRLGKLFKSHIDNLSE